jgi:hypothetical protein
MEAKRIKAPYRVTCVQPPIQPREGTGGGCELSMRCIITGYQYVCINEVWTLAAPNYCFTCNNGECVGSNLQVRAMSPASPSGRVAFRV